jgi:hypothetical protein
MMILAAPCFLYEKDGKDANPGGEIFQLRNARNKIYTIYISKAAE